MFNHYRFLTHALLGRVSPLRDSLLLFRNSRSLFLVFSSSSGSGSFRQAPQVLPGWSVPPPQPLFCPCTDFRFHCTVPGLCSPGKHLIFLLVNLGVGAHRTSKAPGEAVSESSQKNRLNLGYTVHTPFTPMQQTLSLL